ncbi:hypothetical protein OG439_31990 [Amycolatopsis sp. NBC_01307]|uniref:hypothetical protein n=1 Tax=Amycolatopsis sp. NBC_01307 TaxID=2903561 RepID=UPI002E111EC8|nr:hypothetical protein OG439_31990 [Amycolatopsis sp. NBC_01307]
MIEVTAATESAALKWLAGHGQRVGRPAPVLTALIATRQPSRWWRYFLYIVVASSFGVAYSLLFGHGMTESVPIYFLYFGMQLSMWDGFRRNDRALRAWGPSRKPAELWWQVVGGWFLVSLVVAFGGGIALAVTMYPTDRTYAVSWLGLLILSALCTGWVLIGTVRRPLFAETAESLAVARTLRADQVYVVTPILVVVPLVMDLLEDRLPPGFASWLADYSAAVVLLQAVAIIRHVRRYRRLPPGDYGTPPVPDPGTPVDWSPPREAR